MKKLIADRGMKKKGETWPMLKESNEKKQTKKRITKNSYQMKMQTIVNDSECYERKC